MGSERTWAQEMAAFDKWSWEQEGEPIGNLSPAKAAKQAWLARASVDATALSAQEEQIERLTGIINQLYVDVQAARDEAIEGSKRDG